MSISYDMFTSAFLSKITEYEFLSIPEENRSAIIDGYMKRAITSFNKTCVYDLIVRNYFHSLVNCYFKILPIREDGEKTIGVYLESLKAEMLGCGSLLNDIKNDPSYMTLLSILQYFIDHPDCDIANVRREVFRATLKMQSKSKSIARSLKRQKLLGTIPLKQLSLISNRF